LIRSIDNAKCMMDMHNWFDYPTFSNKSLQKTY